MTITIRPATEADINAVKAIADDKTNKPLLGFVSRGELLKAAAASSLLVATSDSVMVGYCAFYRCRTRKPGQFTVNSIAVAVDWRGQGIGRQLIATLIAMQPKLIALKCTDDNPANQFYARLGFTDVGVEVREGRRPLRVWQLWLPADIV